MLKESSWEAQIQAKHVMYFSGVHNFFNVPIINIIISNKKIWKLLDDARLDYSFSITFEIIFYVWTSCCYWVNRMPFKIIIIFIDIHS